MLSRKAMKHEITSASCVARICLCALLSGFAISLGGCATTGAGTKDVTLATIKIVCLSHKDTLPTIQQVAENNGALKALGAPPPNCKR